MIYQNYEFFGPYEKEEDLIDLPQKFLGIAKEQIKDLPKNYLMTLIFEKKSNELFRIFKPKSPDLNTGYINVPFVQSYNANKNTAFQYIFKKFGSVRLFKNKNILSGINNDGF